MVIAMLLLMVFPTAVFAEGEEPGVEAEPVVEETTQEAQVPVEGEESNAGESSPVEVEAEAGLPEPQVAVAAVRALVELMDGKLPEIPAPVVGELVVGFTSAGPGKRGPKRAGIEIQVF